MKAIVDKPIDYADWWDRPVPLYSRDVPEGEGTSVEGREFTIVDGIATFTDEKDSENG